MTLQNYLIVLIGENGNEYSAIKNRVAAEFQSCDITFVHAPIGSNTFVTMNGLHDALTNSTHDFVIVAMVSVFDKANIESAVAKFEGKHNTSQKRLLRKGIGSPNFEWYGQYNLASDIVVARRVDLFDALKRQLSLNQETNRSEGEIKWTSRKS